MNRLPAFALVASLALGGCSSSAPAHTSGACDGPCPASTIRHLVVLVQENHTFDNYFGRYCTAPAGSNPTCSDGPGCCEAGPAMEPGGHAPAVLDDAANGSYDPDHTQACETAEINGGHMDHFVTAPDCGDARNFAYASSSLVMPYWSLAAGGALADRYFQPVVGQSSSNDMYLARARFVFLDNNVKPKAVGAACSVIHDSAEYTDTTIADLLDAHGVSWAWYSEGYAVMKAAQAHQPPTCPDAPADCGAGLGIYPCVYDPSDVPFQYYPALRDNPQYIRDYSAFAADLASGKLPQVVFIKALGYKSEHPGFSTTISDGVRFVTTAIEAVRSSAYADDTLVLVTYDEGGGYFDHVAPPPTSAVDQQPYGTRVPLLAVGRFARRNFVSHATLEHSSLVRFIEWNWLGQQTGQLGTRDAEVNNIGSLLDPATTGVAVPEK